MRAGRITQRRVQWRQNSGFARHRLRRFSLNVTSVEEARALMEELPFGHAGPMKHEFIELGPLALFCGGQAVHCCHVFQARCA
jgi:hypothetical protein